MYIFCIFNLFKKRHYNLTNVLFKWSWNKKPVRLRSFYCRLLTFAWCRTVVPNGKNTPKIRLEKFVKLTDHTCACNDLTNFESEVHAKTGNGRCLNM